MVDSFIVDEFVYTKLRTYYFGTYSSLILLVRSESIVITFSARLD